VDLSPYFKALEASALANSIRDSLLWFPLIESVHVIALALVFGTITIVDLRLLGLASTRRPYGRIEHDLIRWTWGGFVVAAITGVLMFTTNAQVYADNRYFRIKLVLLALAGLNMVVFTVTSRRTVAQWQDNPSGPPAGRIAATLSICLWVSIIVMGRLIGFTTTGAAAKEAPPASTNFDDFLTAAPPGDAPSPPPAAPGK